jgi:hypothetical protein
MKVSVPVLQTQTYMRCSEMNSGTLVNNAFHICKHGQTMSRLPKREDQAIKRQPIQKRRATF